MKEALESKFALSPWVLLAVSIPGILAVPLTEAHGSFSEFINLVLVSITTVLAALLIFLALKPLYRRSIAPWWLTILISTLVGCLKGYLTWILISELGYTQPTLFSRVLFAGLSWGILIPAATILAHTFLELRDRNRSLRIEILNAQLAHDTLDQQLDWLVKTRIEGLSRELAAKFVKLVAQLNQDGLGPRAYQDLASELRLAAKQQVREKSMKVWRLSSRKSAGEILHEMLRTPANLWVVLVVYSGAAIANTLRVEGFGVEFFAVICTAVLLWGILRSSSSPGAQQHFASIFLGASLAILYSILHFEPAMVLQSAIATSIWAEVSIIAGITWNVVLSSFQTRQLELEQNFELTEAESAWLSSRLESNNIQVAKYLHSILQTRLMAYALKIENQGRISEAETAELELLLTKPFVEFGKQYTSLSDGLIQLEQAWVALSQISYTVSADQHNAVDVTLQVLNESVANAVRHGRANKIYIEINDSGKIRNLRVTDNGVAPKPSPAGLGTSIIKSLTVFHNLDANPDGGAILRAEIALA